MNVPTAAKCRDRAQERELWDDKIDNLRGLDAQHAFAEIKSERVGRFVIGDLQNSFIDGEDDDLARPVGFVIDVQRLARLRGRCGIDVDFETAFFLVSGKRNNAVAQRADEDFLGIECADERDVDVTAAFEIFRHANALHTACGLGLEPLLRVNPVALDRD